MKQDLLNSRPHTGQAIGYGYVRFSSDGQSDGDSERRQTAGIEAEAAKRGLQLIMLPPDRAVSAYGGNNLRNGSLGQFIEQARKGKIARGSWLFFEDFDRFSRAEASVAAEAMFTLVNLGIILCTTADGRTCRSGGEVTDFIVPLIKMQGAYDDNKKRAQRIKDSIVAKRAVVSRDAPLTGRVPEWLTVVVLDKAPTGKVIRSRIEEIPDRADLVRRMGEMCAGGWGDGAIARQLNAENKPSFGGGQWHKSYVAKILTNRAVIGELQMYETERANDKRTRSKIGDPVPGYFPETISFDLWRRIEAARASRRTNRSGRPSRQMVNLFSGLCKCATCGDGMELRNKGEKKGGDTLTCSGALRNTGCVARHAYGLHKLEEAFFDHWGAFYARQADFTGNGSSEVGEIAERLDRAEQDMKSAKRRMDNLTEALSEAESADERRPIRAKLGEVRGELDTLTNLRQELVRKLEIARALDDAASRDEMKRVTEEALLAHNMDARRKLAQVLRDTLVDIEFDGDTVVFYPRRQQVGVLTFAYPRGGKPQAGFIRRPARIAGTD